VIMDTDNSDARVRRIEDNLVPAPSIPVLEGGSSTLGERLAYYNTPGLGVAVIDQGHIAWSRGYGVLEEGRDQPVTTSTLFQACSVSKHVTAIGALRLVREGMLDLDQDVNHYLVSWRVPPNGDWEPAVTIRQLLAHTAGLTAGWYIGYQRDEATPSLLDVLEGRPPAATPPVRSILVPGSEFRYAGSHYSVLQQLMADVTLTPFPDFMRDLVFTPLAMVHSSFDQTFPETSGYPAAVGHYLDGHAITGKWRVLPEMAAAGLWTTPEDLARLAVEIQRAYRGEPTAFLRTDAVREMLTLQSPSSYGLGVRLEGEGTSARFGHGGSNLGYRCFTTAYTELGKGVVIMTNADDGIRVGDELLRSLAREYGWPDYSSGDSYVASPDRMDGAYVGEYEFRPTFVVAIRRHGESLALEVPSQPPIPLQPSSAATFFAEVLDAEITFRTDALGTVTGLALRQEGRELLASKRT